jgi:drug/metabolite transporter (DMT)-like permease
MKQNNHTAGHTMALITILIWGTTFISTKILLKDFNPVEILFLRFTMGLVALTVIYPHRLKIRDKKQELTFVFAGLCGVTLYYLLENIALTYSMASNVGVVVSIAPLFTAILAHIFLEDEKLKPNFIVGFLIAIIGISMISFNGAAQLKINPIGDLLALLAAVVWAVYSILTRKISTFGYNTIQTTRRTFFYGLIFMLPALFVFGFYLEPKRLFDPVNLFNLLFLSLGASALCFVTWNLAVKLLGVVKTSIYIYAVPVVTVVSSVTILKEKITAVTLLGTVMTLVGLLISSLKFQQRERHS